MKFLEVTPYQDPVYFFSLFSSLSHSFFLDSSDKKGFSFIGAFPYRLSHSLSSIEEELKRVSQMGVEVPLALSFFPFLGGAVGFISYEAIRQWEPHLGPSKPEPFILPDIQFGFYDTLIAIDHEKQKTFLVSLELTPQSSATFEAFHKTIKEGKKKSFSKEFSPTKVESNMTLSAYKEMILQAKHYIEEGEIYQVNLSHCLFTKLTTDPFFIYKRLRQKNPACFSAYLNLGETQLLSSSPERFLSITSDAIIQTEPIKGTIPRGKTEKEDAFLKDQLLKSEKNRAELMMIVDLERNDLGKICHFNSISVPTLYTVRSFSTVHHLVSTIQGHLKTPHLEEIIKACFPGGSITGAPKLRAMQIIDELEPHNRGIYTGSIGYIDYRGQMDLNIAIRTMVHHNGIFYFPVGGGIVSDSDPLNEYEETLSKGRALIGAVSNS